MGRGGAVDIDELAAGVSDPDREGSHSDGADGGEAREADQEVATPGQERRGDGETEDSDRGPGKGLGAFFVSFECDLANDRLDEVFIGFAGLHRKEGACNKAQGAERHEAGKEDRVLLAPDEKDGEERPEWEEESEDHGEVDDEGMKRESRDHGGLLGGCRPALRPCRRQRAAGSGAATDRGKVLKNQTIAEAYPANDGWPEGDNETPSRLPLWVLTTVLLLLGLDVLADTLRWGGPWHVVLEVVMAVILSVGIAMLWRRFSRERARARALDVRLGETRRVLENTSESLAGARAEAETWRLEAKKAAAGLASAIDEAFGVWGLSRGESEVGFLLIKGLAHKEIAELRGTSERTVRDQAGAIYRKAGVGGRAELSAYFLEDLLPRS